MPPPDKATGFYAMLSTVEDLQSDTLPTPAQLHRSLPLSRLSAAGIAHSRQAFRDIMHGQDDRLAVIIGPCSIHDPRAALDYAIKLAAQRTLHADALDIVMRVYFEKPRSTIGWKGLINDPYLDGSHEIGEGLRIARQLLLDINTLRLPAACEFLDTVTPHYITDLVSWGAIGARTTESQPHRQMASTLPCPVGFKNGTQGDVGIAIDAAVTASHPHHFLGADVHGQISIITSTGNADGHIILRGGARPNYDAASVAAACAQLSHAGLAPRLMVDASHANSGKNPARQTDVIADLATRISAGDTAVFGVMIESHLTGGRQNLTPGAPLTYGQSITDACLCWDESTPLLAQLASAVRARRLTPRHG
jgi:3-deoxy-7-phosphoheptulonate synthase